MSGSSSTSDFWCKGLFFWKSSECLNGLSRFISDGKMVCLQLFWVLSLGFLPSAAIARMKAFSTWNSRWRHLLFEFRSMLFCVVSFWMREGKTQQEPCCFAQNHLELDDFSFGSAGVPVWKQGNRDSELSFGEFRWARLDPFGGF